MSLRHWLRKVVWLGGFCLLGVCCQQNAARAAAGFGLDQVAEKARALAAAPYQEGGATVPNFLTQLTYDEHRDIRFKPEKALWKSEGLPFQLQFFHPGYIFNRSVQIHLVDNGMVRDVPFSSDLFDYGQNKIAQPIPAQTGYAGFRVHYALNRPEYLDELIVFLGASYFRALGAGEQYGISGRGLAVDTALPTGEEFPAFREFWIVQPRKSDTELKIYALLDSPSVAGAYEFTVRPGAQTIVDVTARLWLREDIVKLGIAPMSSMFLFGENEPLAAKLADFRPEVHDSDGLQVHTKTGERVWRPLVNRDRLLVNAFEAENPRGFGLLQRDRTFDHYQDLEARSDLRPSVWILPMRRVVGKDVWSKGRVELVEIPTQNEWNDNIAAYWVPELSATKGSRIDFSYRMKWAAPDDGRTLGFVEGTRVTVLPKRNGRSIIVDFAGGDLSALSAQEAVEADVTLNGTGGHLRRKNVYKNTVTGGWRLVLEVERDSKPGLMALMPRPDEDSVDLRARLKLKDKVLTETWSYAVQP